MLAIDTNVLVRYLTGDHAVQSEKARALIDGERVFVSVTVLLETEWVLRSVYGHGQAAVARTLRGFAGLPNVAIEDAGPAARALDWTEQGMDFADALHLARTSFCDGFATFDREFGRAAGRIAKITLRAP